MARYPKGSTKESRAKEAMLQELASTRLESPARCAPYMRKRLTEEFKGIVQGFVEEAKTGSCPHVKLVTELLKPLPRVKRKKSTITALLEKMEREEAEKQGLGVQGLGVRD